MPVSTLRRSALEVVGDYELIRPLGEGGMGRVHLARHRTTGVEVVVKRIHAEREDDPAFRRRFQSELRTMRRFRHPNAVALLGASAADEEQPFLVLEFVHGHTPHELLESEGRLSAARVGPILGELCVVLQAAHNQGIVHRDLTPANLMLVQPGTARASVKVMDFGLAQLGGFYLAPEKLQGDDASIGGGTPDYVCPEQVRGETVDARGDLYSVGVLLYRALTGHLPFEQYADVHAILLAHRDQAPPTFADLDVADVAPEIEEVVQRCLAKFPAQRPQSARELAEQFGAALGEPIAAPEAFDTAEHKDAAPDEPVFAVDTLIDRLQAWLPEQIAVMKLRGFVEGVGGAVVDSLPGLIRVRLPGPASAVTPPPTGFWGWFRSAPTLPPDEVIELHLRSKPPRAASLVDLTPSYDRIAPPRPQRK